MTDQIDELKQAYRDVKAPPALATRIRAEVAGQKVRSRSWVPVGATVMAILLVAWFMPYVGDHTVSPSGAPRKPSLTAIAALKPAAPARRSVSLSQLKTLKKPKLPTRPRLEATESQTNLESKSNLLEEKDYVLS